MRAVEPIDTAAASSLERLHLGAAWVTSVQTIEGHVAFLSFGALARLKGEHDISDRWFIAEDPEGHRELRAFRASDDTQVYPTSILDLIAPPCSAGHYALKNGNPLDLTYANLAWVEADEPPF